MREIYEYSNKGTYYSIAFDDFQYLFDQKDSKYVNHIAPLCQQCAEKYLKSIIVDSGVPLEDKELLKSHSLVKLASYIEKNIIPLQIDRRELRLLTDFYYDTRYPGDNFYIIDEIELKSGLELLYIIKDIADNFHNNLDKYKKSRTEYFEKNL